MFDVNAFSGFYASSIERINSRALRSPRTGGKGEVPDTVHFPTFLMLLPAVKPSDGSKDVFSKSTDLAECDDRQKANIKSIFIKFLIENI